MLTGKKKISPKERLQGSTKTADREAALFRRRAYAHQVLATNRVRNSCLVKVLVHLGQSADDRRDIFGHRTLIIMTNRSTQNEHQEYTFLSFGFSLDFMFNK